MRTNSMLQRVATPYGEIRSQAPHWNFEKTPAEIKRGCPLLGRIPNACSPNWRATLGRTRYARAMRLPAWEESVEDLAVCSMVFG